MFQRGVELQHSEWWRWRIRGKASNVQILLFSLMVISCSAVERKISVSEAKFAWDSRKSSKISSEVVIKCEGWACTIVEDFEPAEKTNRSRSRVQGGNKGMYSSSEASVSRADSPVIFVVRLCFSFKLIVGWLWASCVLSYYRIFWNQSKILSPRKKGWSAPSFYRLETRHANQRAMLP